MTGEELFARFGADVLGRWEDQEANVQEAWESLAAGAAADQERPACPTDDCDGDARYAAPGRGHRDGCRYPDGEPLFTPQDPGWHERRDV